MHFDGSKMRGGLGVGIILTSSKGDKMLYVLQIHFAASNNIAEYEALIHGLKLAKEIGIRRILYFGDSDLVVQQASGDWDAKDANMASYCFYVQQLCGFFEGCEFHHVPRANYEEADQLSKIGSIRQAMPAGVSLEIIHKPSIKPSPKLDSICMQADPAPAKAPPPDLGAAASGAAVSEQTKAASQSSKAGTSADPRAADPLVECVFHVREIPSWAEPFSNYLLYGDLPSSAGEARRLQHRA
jgi:ribonuclease HI